MLVINWLKSLFQSKTKENILSFACGDIMAFHLLGIPPEATILFEKMFSTLVLAAIGGAGGWLGKELVIWVWNRMKPAFKKKK